MKESEFYYGLPESQWDPLLVAAEDLLRDEELGTHLVGMYPAGNRIYGLESESPGLFCLYIDSVEALINPNSPKREEFRTFTIGHSGSSILMMNLFDWAKWILNRPNSISCSIPSLYFAYALPFGQDVIYQDDAICDILDIAKKLMHITKFRMIYSGCSRDYPIIEALHARTKMILSMTNHFYPCINPEWGKVYNISTLGCSSNMVRLDNILRNSVLGRAEPLNKSERLDLIYMYEEKIDEASLFGFEKDTFPEYNELKNNLGSAVSALYRFQL